MSSTHRFVTESMSARLSRCALLLVGSCGFTQVGLGETLNMPIAVAWGYNGQGQGVVPLSVASQRIQQVIGGGNHTMALTEGGEVRAWGYNAQGQCNVPTGLSLVREIGATTAHSAALRVDGSVVCWGDNSKGQCNVPSDLGSVSHIAGGNYHILAILQDGTVRVWGDNSKGQCNVPSSLMNIVSSGPTGDHPVVINGTGQVVAWGSNGSGESSVPANLDAAVQVCGGGWFSLALRANGAIVAWGRNNYGQCNVPEIQGGAVEVSAGGDFGVALSSSGELIYWGRTAYGESRTPSTLLQPRGISAGGGHMVVLAEGDCDSDGELDSAAITADRAVDQNANRVPDTCDIALGWEEDCNLNGIIDSFEQSLNQPAAADSGALPRIGFGHPQQWVYASPSLSLNDPVLTIRAYGDFGAPGETLTVTLNGRFVGTFLADGADKNDCRASITRAITLPRAFYNECVSAPGGATDAIFDFTTSVAVNADQCPSGSWVRAQLTYTAAVAGDCNANSLLDTCEIALDASIDANTDGVIDACQGMGVTFLCPGDLDGGGSVDTADLSLLLMSFGASMPGDPADLDENGHVDTADVSLMLLGFGPC